MVAAKAQISLRIQNVWAMLFLFIDIFYTSRKHAYIILTPLNPIFM